MRAAFDAARRRAARAAARCRNRIPHGRGLGLVGRRRSSPGVVGAWALVRRDVDGVDDDAVLALATELEGHPDNVAAVPARRARRSPGPTATGAGAVRLDRRTRGIAPGACSSRTRRCRPHVARGLLPDDGAARRRRPQRRPRRAAGARADQRPGAAAPATEDRLHQDYRAAGDAGVARAGRPLRAGGHAAVVSGAGPSVLVAAPAGRATTRRRLDRAAACTPTGWTVLPARGRSRRAQQVAGRGALRYRLGDDGTRSVTDRCCPRSVSRV